MAAGPELQPFQNEEWREKVDHLLHAALERQADERSAFLQECCAGDDSLLREVESLLSAYVLGRDFLENPALEEAMQVLQRSGDLEGIEVGPYSIQSLLGSGGMGEVYRATDSRLNRAVAIKFLTSAESIETRLQYFEREARLASSLNHPNIVTIYEFGASEFGPYIAMEWVDGKTLREIVADGPVPLDRVLQLASQVADGLAKAHAAGIFHRDLKPENLMVTADGIVKILDFGLAKLAPPAGLEPDNGRFWLSTKRGVILGTVGYMSPEQAGGRPADFRSDQFSLGAIVYEMVTGKRAFDRDSPIETLSAIIRDEPESLVSLSPQTAVSCRRVIERCLSKRPEERYPSTSELAADLRNLRDHLQEISALDEISYVARDSSKTSNRRVLRWAGLSVLIIAALIAASRAAPLIRQGMAELSRWLPGTTPAGDPITFSNGHVSDARFTADNRVIYAAAWVGDKQQLYSILPGTALAEPLGIMSAGIWSISQKGDMAIAYPCRLNWGVCYGPLAVVLNGTKEPLQVLEDYVTAADWSRTGGSLIAAEYSEDGYQIVEVPFPVGSNMGAETNLRVLYKDAGWVTDIRVLPDNQIAFIEHTPGELRGSVCVLGTDGKKWVLSAGWKTVLGLDWHPITQEIWFTGSREGRSLRHQLTAVTLDRTERSVANVSRSVLNDISQDGHRVLIREDSPHGWIRGLVPEGMNERDLTYHDYSTLADLSSDGKTLLFYEWGDAVQGVHTAYLRSTDGSAPKPLGQGKPLALSPDGRWVLALQDTQPPQLVLFPTAGGQPTILPRGDIERFRGWAAWTPDSRRIAFSAIEGGGRVQTYIQDVGNGLPKPVTRPGIAGFLLSPDGNLLAVRDQYGEHYLYDMSRRESRLLEGIQENELPLQWSSDGRAIFLRDLVDDELNIYKLDIETGVRTLWKRLAPPVTGGLIGIGFGPGEARITPDGQFFAYTYWTAPSELSVSEGFR